MSLSTRAMLVDLDISQWTARKLDRRETEEVLIRNNARSRVARVNKSLLPGAGSLEAVTKKAGEIRNWFYARTLPWLSSGARIIKTEGYLDFTSELQRRVSEWDRLVDRFVMEYPDLVQAAQDELQGLYDPNDYPPVEHIRDKFSIRARFAPVPDADDWRIQLADDEIASLKAQITRDVLEAQSSAMKEAWKRLYECVEHAVERLSDPKAIFRDSLVKNAEELCRILPSLNLTNDPLLEARRQELERALCGLDPKDLRKYPDLRKQTADQLQDIKNKMGAFYQMAA